MVLDILTENNHSTSDFSLQNILKYIQYLGELWKSTGHSHVLLSLLPFKMGSYSSYLINQSNEVFFFIKACSVWIYSNVALQSTAILVY